MPFMRLISAVKSLDPVFPVPKSYAGGRLSAFALAFVSTGRTSTTRKEHGVHARECARIV